MTQEIHYLKNMRLRQSWRTQTALSNEHIFILVCKIFSFWRKWRLQGRRVALNSATLEFMRLKASFKTTVTTPPPFTIKYTKEWILHSAAASRNYYWSKNFFRSAEQKFCKYWIRLTRNARNCNARSGKVGSSHCYLDRRPLHEIATFKSN